MDPKPIETARDADLRAVQGHLREQRTGRVSWLHVRAHVL